MPEINQFAGVVRQHHASLRYFIRSLGVQSAWVDDLAQEAFLLAYRKWEDLDEVGNAGLWLCAIAKNLVMNELSKTSRRQRLLDENMTTLLLAAEGGGDERPASVADRGIRHEALRDCMAKLPERSRQVVHARYFDDQNSSEIGSDLKMTTTAVRQVLFRSRQLLADCLQRKSIHEAT
ncbi:sigma-70 family RNA polymerase sigma factor [Luteolibacter arcticus]|uniref:Sigma-70 family RNA polymerase sigma factor n=1 Tax=Luteolibacter arcticus TaxID=1581411 RepID=A0ABT3GKN1_9BACT|nr:sigma-70 family RNA polymerase sigma factor [Luteolibacter arcticus]MCW1924083.1 sigma-70 family RNA polymerase sigma factor [Luteolibacter arcticus]